ncbi:hypothetical protein STCU_10098 [Strigomonas culicis]|uniref:Uncharacterized protein n=1 Tax=Strigomonas culicis TaxID=28005 RepID=S9TND7_9TRYP|nr:hypothetical protein STCU_10098 [Strigomonas culicis]|eukprot:EPY18244.1 hypothetical protein STCU_10098 [Strigomonas culicis]
MSTEQNHFSGAQWKAVLSAFPFYYVPPPPERRAAAPAPVVRPYAAPPTPGPRAYTWQMVQDDFVFFVEHTVGRLGALFPTLVAQAGAAATAAIVASVAAERPYPDATDAAEEPAIGRGVARWRACLPPRIDRLLHYLYTGEAGPDDARRYRGARVHPLTCTEVYLGYLHWRERQRSQFYYNFYFNFKSVFRMEEQVATMRRAVVAFADYCDAFAATEGQRAPPAALLHAAPATAAATGGASQGLPTAPRACHVCHDAAGDLYWCARCQTFQHEVCGGNLRALAGGDGGEAAALWCRACRRAHRRGPGAGRDGAEVQPAPSTPVAAVGAEANADGSGSANRSSAASESSASASLCSDTSEEEQLELKRLYGSRYKKYQRDRVSRAFDATAHVSSDDSLADFIVDTEGDETAEEEEAEEEESHRRKRKLKKKQEQKREKKRERGQREPGRSQKRKREEVEVEAECEKKEKHSQPRWSKKETKKDLESEDDELLFSHPRTATEIPKKASEKQEKSPSSSSEDSTSPLLRRHT